MEYCNLGNSGLQVSRLGLGAIPFGTTLDESDSARMLGQFEQNLEVSEIELSDAEMAELRNASELPHPYPNSFWDPFCYRESEFYGGLR